MADNDLIIGGASGYNWDQLKYWVNSIKKTGYTGSIVLVATNMSGETVKKLTENNVSVYAYGKRTPDGGIEKTENNIPPHVERFLFIWDYLRKNENEYRFVTVTDTRDVIFQKDPFEWMEHNNIGRSSVKLVAPSEAMYYKDEPWNRDNLRQAYGDYFYENLGFKNMLISCCGVIAGTSEYVKDLVFNMFANSINRPIPVVDQVVFNMLINTQPYKGVTYTAPMSTAWTLQAGTMNDPTKVEQFKDKWLELPPYFYDGKFLTAGGNEFCIVHQYDRVPEWKKYVEQKFRQEDQSNYFRYTA